MTGISKKRKDAVAALVRGEVARNGRSLDDYRDWADLIECQGKLSLDEWIWARDNLAIIVLKPWSDAQEAPTKEEASPPPPKGEPPLSRPEADKLRAELAVELDHRQRVEARGAAPTTPSTNPEPNPGPLRVEQGWRVENVGGDSVALVSPSGRGVLLLQRGKPVSRLFYSTDHPDVPLPGDAKGRVLVQGLVSPVEEEASPPPPKGEPPLSRPEADKLRAELAAARVDASRLWSVLGGVMEVIRHSTGVAGWRHDGMIQPWEDLPTAEVAREALASRAPKGSHLLRLLCVFADRADWADAAGSSSPTGREWHDAYDMLRQALQLPPGSVPEHERRRAAVKD